MSPSGPHAEAGVATDIGGVADTPQIEVPPAPDYGAEIALLPRRPAAALRWIVAAVVLLALPQIFGEYWLNQFNYVMIYALSAIGLQILLGYTGQISIAHAAFMGIGAYACNYLEQHGVTFVVAFIAGGILAAATGAAIAVPARRVSGLSLLVATMAFNFIVVQVLGRWVSVTKGYDGVLLKDIDLFGHPVTTAGGHYYLYLAVLVLGMLIALNIVRSPLGRAMNAVRDSEVAARSMGVDLSRVKMIAFAISALFGGLAGALYAHQITFISPDQFGLGLSLDMIIMLIVGGAGSIAGVVLGGIFLVVLPELLDYFFAAISAGGEPVGVRPILEGGILILIMLFEPWGLYGLWLRLKRRILVLAARRRSAEGRPDAA